MGSSGGMRAVLGRAWLELADALYPPRCILCGDPDCDGPACAVCALPAAPPPPRCGRCSAALAPALPDGYPCAACRLRSPGFARLVALADYRAQPVVRPWLMALKYGRRPDLAQPLGTALGRRLLESGCMRDGIREVLVPVPLHPWRRLERGCDQALLLARAAGEAAGVEVLRALARRRATPPQGAPGSVSRRANVRGAFRGRSGAASDLAGRPVWLVDDVVTSGATAAECARVLRRLGAREVSVLCAARAGP